MNGLISIGYITASYIKYLKQLLNNNQKVKNNYFET